MADLIKKLKKFINDLRHIKKQNHDLRLQIGSLLVKLSSTDSSFQEAEFKVFSQFGDDGIIQYLIRNIKPKIHKFIEFGVENYEESNTRFLLLHDNWEGLVIDGSNKNIDYIKKDSIYWLHSIVAVQSFITAENINNIIHNNGYEGGIGLLSIDIDGNDYWVWKAINVIDADIVIVEYNAIFGPDRSITIPYDPNFVRNKFHFSYLYRGSSLSALYRLGLEKGYSLVGCNKAGNNAYFVKNNKLGSLCAMTPSEAYVQAHFRESRASDGTLSFANFEKQRELISGQPVYNIITNQIEPF